jgi:hypothetical protein
MMTTLPLPLPLPPLLRRTMMTKSCLLRWRRRKRRAAEQSRCAQDQNEEMRAPRSRGAAPMQRESEMA